MLETMINSFQVLYKLWDTGESDPDEIEDQISCMQANLEKATGQKIEDILK